MTKLEKEVRKEKKYAEKVLLTLVVAFAIVSFWRGVWGLQDTYLFPNNYQLSVWMSLFIGIAILYLTESLMKKLI
jgi:hypothetical protein